MATFKCSKCNEDFDTTIQHVGYHQSFHQTSCQVLISNGHILITWSTNGNLYCPMNLCIMTFIHNDNLQCHVKAHYAKVENSSANQQQDDWSKGLQRARTLGALIQPPTFHTRNLLMDTGLIVANINNDVRLLLCKDCNVCLELDPCQVHTHLLKQGNHCHLKCHHHGDEDHNNEQCVGNCPLASKLPTLFMEIQFTLLHDHHLQKYNITSI
jgi:hypothetical protein